MNRFLTAAAILIAFAIPSRALEARHADHEALRAILQQVTTALNTRNLDSLDPLFAPKFSVVTIDQKRFTSLPDLKAYFTGFFGGEHALLKSVEFHPEADELTEFVAPDVGVAQGVSNDSYHFADGDARQMKTRWSAVVVKDKGAWKIASLHTGVDVMDNPVLAAAKSAAGKLAAIGALMGFVAGFLFSKIFAARRA